MKVLVTGSKGFIGKHLCYALKRKKIDFVEFEKEDSEEYLFKCIDECAFIVHLAGAMRPVNASDFYDINRDLTYKICQYVKKTKNKCSILLASSTQTSSNTDYGISKLEAEKICLDLENSGNKVFIFRFTNAFGKWGKPNYNSVVATFCNNIAKGESIRIDNPSTVVNFIYIDDIVKAIVERITNPELKIDNPCKVLPEYPISIKELADLIYYFDKCYSQRCAPYFKNNFSKLLYNEYLFFKVSKFYTVNEENEDACNILNSENAFSLNVLNVNPFSTKNLGFYDSINQKIVLLEGCLSLRIWLPFSNETDSVELTKQYIDSVIIPAGYICSLSNKNERPVKVLQILSDDFSNCINNYNEGLQND